MKLKEYAESVGIGYEKAKSMKRRGQIVEESGSFRIIGVKAGSNGSMSDPAGSETGSNDPGHELHAPWDMEQSVCAGCVRLSEELRAIDRAAFAEAQKLGARMEEVIERENWILARLEVLERAQALSSERLGPGATIAGDLRVEYEKDQPGNESGRVRSPRKVEPGIELGIPKSYSARRRK